MNVRERLGRTRPGYSLPLGRVLAIYMSLMVALFLATLETTVVASAGPHIALDLGAIDGYAGLFTAYLLAATVTIPLYGRLGDVYGRRPMLLIAVSLFVVGSALCASAQGMTELVVFRAVQGLGAGGLLPLSLAVIAGIIPPRERGRWHGLFNAVWAGSSLLGPAVGGLIVDNTSWRWVFLLNVPIGAVTLLVIALSLPRRVLRVEDRKIDWTGAAVLAVLAGAVVLLAGSVGRGWASAAVQAEIVVALVALVLFVVVTRRAADPIVPFGALRSPIISGSIACTALGSIVLYGTLSYVPLFVQGVMGATATSSGVALTPLLLGAVVASFTSGQLVSRTGRYRWNVLLGPLAVFTGSVLLWRLNADATSSDAARAMVIVGIGLGSIFQVFILTVQNAAKREQIGTVTAFSMFARHMGATIGIAIMGTIVGWRLPAAATAHHELIHRLPPDVRESLASALHGAFVVTTVAAAALWIVAVVWVKETPLRGFVEPIGGGAATGEAEGSPEARGDASLRPAVDADT